MQRPPTPILARPENLSRPPLLRLVPNPGPLRPRRPGNALGDASLRGLGPTVVLPRALPPGAERKNIHTVHEYHRHILDRHRSPLTPGNSLLRLIPGRANLARIYWEGFGRFGSRRYIIDRLVEIVEGHYGELKSKRTEALTGSPKSPMPKAA